MRNFLQLGNARKQSRCDNYHFIRNAAVVGEASGCCCLRSYRIPSGRDAEAQVQVAPRSHSPCPPPSFHPPFPFPNFLSSKTQHWTLTPLHVLISFSFASSSSSPRRWWFFTFFLTFFPLSLLPSGEKSFFKFMTKLRIWFRKTFPSFPSSNSGWSKLRKCRNFEFSLIPV